MIINMKKSSFFMIIIFLIIVSAIAFIIISNLNSPNITNNTEISRISTNINNSNTSNIQFNNTMNPPANTLANNAENNTPPAPKTPVETELASFSTKIYTKDSERQNNITIACAKLHDTTVNPGETFSFCDTLGPSTSAEGYQEADIFIDGEVTQALGGGKCQISTTLYNAVLNSAGLEVIERHEHSSEVPYIEDGKDAAVSYGGYDFKFKNNTGKTVKVFAGNTEDNITIRLVTID